MPPNQKAYVWLLAPERNRHRLSKGFEYRIWDGRFIGQGTILKVINPILNNDEEVVDESHLLDQLNVCLD